MTIDLRLHEAARSGDLDGVRRLLAEGLPIDAQDATGQTPVMAATVARKTAVVRALVDAGADVDIRDDRLDNVLLYAGANGLLDLVRIANEAGADPAITNRFGGIALIPACERGHVETVRYLLAESDVDVDHVNRLGWTGLLEAIILSDGGPAHREIVRLLLDAGADPELADRDGVTPLAHARSKGFEAIAAQLVAAGATR
jgi:ankyrin repeat protein